MEDGLRGVIKSSIGKETAGLNPCFNGRWSASNILNITKENTDYVLILVLMEDGLREKRYMIQQ